MWIVTAFKIGALDHYDNDHCLLPINKSIVWIYWRHSYFYVIVARKSTTCKRVSCYSFMSTLLFKSTLLSLTKIMFEWKWRVTMCWYGLLVDMDMRIIVMLADGMYQCQFGNHIELCKIYNNNNETMIFSVNSSWTTQILHTFYDASGSWWCAYTFYSTSTNL
jgi:hypothetical protein